VPSTDEILRLVAWILVTAVYVGLWLAFGLLLSVLVRRAATSALIGFGAWFLLVIFGSFIADLVANTLSPLTGSTIEQALPQAQLQKFITSFLPGNLYRDVTDVLLNPRLNPSIQLPARSGRLSRALSRSRIRSSRSIRACCSYGPRSWRSSR
jgi:ABC-2 type transport system permease protein